MAYDLGSESELNGFFLCSALKLPPALQTCGQPITVAPKTVSSVVKGHGRYLHNSLVVTFSVFFGERAPRGFVPHVRVTGDRKGYRDFPIKIRDGRGLIVGF
jgi:hypothetical protein